MKGGIAVLASLVTILGFFGLRTIYDLFPNVKDQEQAAETQTAERAGREYKHHQNQGTERPVAQAKKSATLLSKSLG
jgi:hypothetical protein